MASFVENVRILIDVVTKNGANELKNLRSELDNTEGGFAKAKVAAGGFGDFVKSNMGAAVTAGVAGAGAAIATFVVKVGGDFQELALKVDNFRQKTGTSADEASRWIEVAGDLGVEADSVATAFGRFEREDASGALAKYGLTAQDASGRFAELLGKIGAIPDENERAAAAFQVFGKGWQAMAPLLDSTENLNQRLAEVSGHQLVSDEQVREARDFRDKLDDLNDKLESFTNWVGEKAVAAVTSLIDAANSIGGPIADLADKIKEADDSSGGLLSTVADVGGTIANEYLNPVTQAEHLTDAWGTSVDALTTGFGLWGDSSDDTSDKIAQMGGTIRSAQVDEKELADATKVSTEQAKEHAEAVDASNKRLKEQAAALEESKRRLAEQQNAALGVFGAELNLHQAVTDVNQKLQGQAADSDTVKEALLGAAEKAADLAEKQAEAAGKTFDGTQKTQAMIGQLNSMKDDTIPGLNAVIDDYIARLKAIPTQVTTTVTVNTPQGVGTRPGQGGRIALQSGGVVPGPVDAPVAAIVHGGEVVLNRDQQAQVRGLVGAGGGVGGSGNIYVTVNAGWGADGHGIADAIVTELKKYERRNGRVPVKTL